MALAIIIMVLGGVLVSYTQTSQQAEWSGYSLAAQAAGIQQLEQARAGVWDAYQGKNDLTNLSLLNWKYDSTNKICSGYTTMILDVPISGSNYVVATNFVKIKMVNLNGVTTPSIQVQMVTVDTVWPFIGRFGTNWCVRLYTNHAAIYCATDDQDANSL